MADSCLPMTEADLNQELEEVVRRVTALAG